MLDPVELPETNPHSIGPTSPSDAARRPFLRSDARNRHSGASPPSTLGRPVIADFDKKPGAATAVDSVSSGSLRQRRAGTRCAGNANLERRRERRVNAGQTRAQRTIELWDPTRQTEAPFAIARRTQALDELDRWLSKASEDFGDTYAKLYKNKRPLLTIRSFWNEHFS